MKHLPSANVLCILFSSIVMEMFIATLVWTVASFCDQHSCFTNPNTFGVWSFLFHRSYHKTFFPHNRYISTSIPTHSKKCVKGTSCPPVSSKLLLAHSFSRCWDLVGNSMQVGIHHRSRRFLVVFAYAYSLFS